MSGKRYHLPRPRTYVDRKRRPPYSQDRMRWSSSQLGTYVRPSKRKTAPTQETTTP